MQWTLSQAQHTSDDEDALWQMLFYAAHMAKDGYTDYQHAKVTPGVFPYVVNWGLPGDTGVIARTATAICGAVWVRHVTDTAEPYYPLGTYKLAIAVHPDIRGQGLGHTLMCCMCALADQARWSLSLTVRRDNPALALYHQHQFIVVKTLTNRVGSESFLMVRHQVLSKEVSNE